jgi:hypothetical protein
MRMQPRQSSTVLGGIERMVDVTLNRLSVIVNDVLSAISSLPAPQEVKKLARDSDRR